MRWLRRIVLAVLVALAVAGVGGYLWLRTSLPQLDGAIELAGLSQPVEVIRDRDGIPHIRAKTEADAYFALGFVHAQDRLFQMDFQRRLAAGRLSEVVGGQTVAVDRVMRVLGLYRLAEASLEHLSPETRRALDAYAAGVNAFLEHRAGSLPVEFVLLRYEPERWKPADSLLWGRLMGLRLSGNWGNEAFRARLAGTLTAEQIEDLWPRYDGEAPPTVSDLASGAPASMLAGLLEAFPDSLGRISASNSWALAGPDTSSGKPILANDPHLGFSAPNLWYLARIEAPGLSVTGATVPGVPFTVLGHNGRIAWSFTTTESDTQDLFVERLTAGAPDHYDTPDGPRPFVTRQESIGVRGAEPVGLVVRQTRHGPVISDIIGDARGLAGQGHVVALAAAAMREDDRTAEALYRLNRAEGWTGFLDAMRLFHSPHQNITYADVDGNIGFVAPARVPVRRNGDGLVPAPGWTGAHDWTGFIPFDELPRAFNPAGRRIVSANHRVAPDDYPHFLGRIRTPPYRAERIHQRLTATTPHRPTDSAALQLDVVSLAARDLLPLMTAIRPTQALSSQALSLLARWDGAMDRDRPEPLIFTAWLRNLNRLLYADELGDAFPDYWGLRPVFVRLALTRKQRWCDDVGTPDTESCETILSRALATALAGLAEEHGGDPRSWRWGSVHLTRFRHLAFGRVPFARWLLDRFDVVIETGGSTYTVNTQGIAIGNARRPFAGVHGPGYRAIYDLADLDASLFVQATGQSGNVFSPLYDSFVTRWRDGQYVTISGARDRALEDAIGVLRLMPAREGRQ